MQTRSRTWFAAGMAVLVLAAACGDGGSEGSRSELLEELRATGIGDRLGRPVPAPEPNGRWQTYRYPPSPDGPSCLYGDPEAPYQVFVREGPSDDVLFYLEGGGACWSDETCWQARTAKTDAEPFAPLEVFRGVLAEDDPRNPFADWDVVYASYCDGSVFSGDNVVDYPSGRVYHRGIANLSAAIDVMRSRFPAPGRIVVSGSSAGGFGTLPGYRVMRLAYPETQILVLNDSGPGLQNEDEREAIEQRSRHWRFERFVPASCTECGGQPAFAIDWGLARDPELRTAMFSYLDDFVVSAFLALDGPAYEALLRRVTDELHARHPERFERFFVAGASHTILLGAGIAPGGGIGVEGTFRSLAIDGVGLPEWLADFLADGPRWRDLIEDATAGDG